jgi:hypothetical protein
MQQCIKMFISYLYEIKILIHCYILLDFLCELYYDVRIHEHQTQKRYKKYMCVCVCDVMRRFHEKLLFT